MAPPLSPNDRERIILLKLSGHKVAEISRLTGITRQTIHFWLKRWDEFGDLTAHRRQLYKRSTTAPQDAEIVAACAADPQLSPKVLSSRYRISVDTVRRRLKEARHKMQQPQSQTSNNECPNSAPLISLSDNPGLPTSHQSEELQNSIQTHIQRLNNQFVRVTNILSEEVTRNNLLIIKRLERNLGAIQTNAQAKSFVLAKLNTNKKRKKPQSKSATRRNDIGIHKSLKKQKSGSDINALQMRILH